MERFDLIFSDPDEQKTAKDFSTRGEALEAVYEQGPSYESGHLGDHLFILPWESLDDGTWALIVKHTASHFVVYRVTKHPVLDEAFPEATPDDEIARFRFVRDVKHFVRLARGQQWPLCSQPIAERTFEAWQASRTHYHDIQSALRYDNGEPPMPGYAYESEQGGTADTYIEEPSPGQYVLTIDRSIFEDTDLAKLERLLYDYSVREGYIK